MFTSGNQTQQQQTFPNSDAGVEELVNSIVEQKRSDRLSLDLSRSAISVKALESLEQLPNLAFVALPIRIADHEAVSQFQENHPDVEIRPAAFKISKAVLCDTVSGYGLFESLTESRQNPGDELFAYLELNGVKSSSQFGTYTTQLQTSYELIDSQGQVVDRQESPLQRQISRGVPRQVHVTQPIKLPESLADGEYQLKVRVTNELPKLRRPIPPRSKDSQTRKAANPSVETTLKFTVSRS